MVAVLLTFVSLVLTLAIGAVFLLGAHQLVTMIVRHLETRPTYSDDARRTLRSLAVRRPARR
ncbi:MAG: hypothetical protein EON53_09005 [Actinomycetales bacterium]|uniref:hypothetical protein n=1 Tax=Aeromicrobium sp. Leaf245 TaxID=1736306 RepID=UPI0006F2548E|nr:hypothetical protein [Aeromicrobium sp. Leaf245]KQP27663.1 hypothetical protein ASF38_02000 [Aeromicrobium sp. Leaf272]KQP78606.1 hypothetical protein ASF37_08700 [Aeromicrobium sp. Leaf289]KQP84317.1 hypothetical protein ASF35_05200 [Aeromicrobium sp. Leaf291]RYY46478.1 MAG: hypothetical protein EON53_09005 [Actinomycetales bacterium]KQO36174.1 hypothetical protein ASF05_08155 [Aeromicrobium sp. Leaf245]